MSVYLDYAATAPIRPEVAVEYAQYLGLIGNPSSTHHLGQQARRAVEEAREVVALAVGCHRSEVIFTSGGTEADNLAIKGLYWQRNGEDSARKVIITSAIEHHAVLDTVEFLATQGAEVLFIPVDRAGALDLAWLSDVLAARGGEVALITLMLANNETGVVSPIGAVAGLANEHGIPVHTDAVAAFGHTGVNYADLGVATLAISGHKIGAPVGIGALIVGRRVKLKPVQQGGGQERALRPGTMNAAGAKAFAKAAQLALEELDAEAARLSGLRDRLAHQIKAVLPVAELTATGSWRLPGTLHLRLPECQSDSLLFLLDQKQVAVSAGSACSAGVTGVSHVLLGMGFSEQESTGSLRITLGYNSSEVDTNTLLDALPAAYEAAKRAS
jgi:cysteine desulfurase